MTRTVNGGYGVVRLDDRRGPVGSNEKGIIIATSEDRVAGWLRDLLLPCMGRRYVLRYASRKSELNSLVLMPGMGIAFIEVGFFGEAMTGCLEQLRKLRPKLRIVLFTVSVTQLDDAAYYLHWSGGSFISLRDRPERIRGNLESVFGGENVMPENVLREMGEYDRIPAKKPNLTFHEIEVVRCRARGKTRTETAHCLNISVRTADNHLANVRRKFGIRNIVGILRLAVSRGILSGKELRSGRFK